MLSDDRLSDNCVSIRLLSALAKHIVLFSFFSFVLGAQAYAGGSFSQTGNLIHARLKHTATLLNNGQVLITGGCMPGANVLNAAELYDPPSQSFLPTGKMVMQRCDHSATLLQDGTVLLAGGLGGGANGVLSSAEIYNPLTGTFSPTAGTMTSRRVYHTAALLQNGQVLIAGGSDGINILSSAELYDPATGTFSPTTGGTLATPLISNNTALMPSVVLQDGRVLIPGGSNAKILLATSQLYGPATESFSTAATTMTTPRWYHQVNMLDDGTALITGGYSSITGYLKTAETFDPATGLFTATAGDMTSQRLNHTATPLLNGSVLIAGGVSLGWIPLPTVDLYDPAARTFSPTGSLMTSREYHTATLLQDGTVLIAGGSPDGVNGLATAELFTLEIPMPSSTYYISYSTGSNTNNGTSKSTPWKTHPYMQTAAACTDIGSAPVYVHAHGDVFIFMQGDSWPNACFDMVIQGGGSPGKPDQYTYDSTWGTVSFATPVTVANLGLVTPVSSGAPTDGTGQTAPVSSGTTTVSPVQTAPSSSDTTTASSGQTIPVSSGTTTDTSAQAAPVISGTTTDPAAQTAPVTSGTTTASAGQTVPVSSGTTIDPSAQTAPVSSGANTPSSGQTAPVVTPATPVVPINLGNVAPPGSGATTGNLGQTVGAYQFNAGGKVINGTDGINRFVYDDDIDNITINGVELTGVTWDGYGGWGDNVWLIDVQQSRNFVLSNCYAHNWTYTNPVDGGDVLAVMVGNGNNPYNVGSKMSGCVVDGSNSGGPGVANSGDAAFAIPGCDNNIIKNVTNGCLVNANAIVHDNNIGPVNMSLSPSAHPNCIEPVDPVVGGTSTIYIYNNVIHDCTAVAILAQGTPAAGSNEIDYIWNNVFYVGSVPVPPIPIQFDSVMNPNTGSEAHVWNNTIYAGPMLVCIRTIDEGNGNFGHLDFQNNFCMSDRGLTLLQVPGNTQITNNNVVMSTADANAAGLNSSQPYAYQPIAPDCGGLLSSILSCPMGAGTNLANLATGSLLSLASDTTYGNQRTATPRPTIGPVDAGAYQLSIPIAVPLVAIQ